MKLTPEFVAMREAGYSFTQISQKYGFSREAIMRYVRKGAEVGENYAIQGPRVKRVSNPDAYLKRKGACFA